MTAVISALWVYPVKACQGVELKKADVTRSGSLALDRCWCVVDTRGDRQTALQSLSQRNLPALASICVSICLEEGAGRPVALRLEAPGMQALRVGIDAGWHHSATGLGEAPEAAEAYTQDAATGLQVECGGMSTTSAGGWHLGLLQGESCGEEAADWLSEYLNQPHVDKQRKDKPQARYALVRSTATRNLSVYMGASQKPFSVDTALQRLGKASPFKMHNVPCQPEDGIVFQDVAPLHLANEQSVQDLRSRMHHEDPSPEDNSTTIDKTFSVRCFRPNIVVKTLGKQPWSEDNWARFSIGDVDFAKLKNCPRCTVPARNPTTGEFLFKKKALLAQKTMRRFWPEKCVDAEWEVEWEGPCFGIHVTPNIGVSTDDDVGSRVLRVGDGVLVSKWVRSKAYTTAMMVLLASVLVLVCAVAYKLKLENGL